MVVVWETLKSVDWANWIGNAIVPFLSVWVAARLVRSDDKRKSTRDTFLSLNQNIRKYIFAFTQLRQFDAALVSSRVTSEAKSEKPYVMTASGARERNELVGSLYETITALDNDRFMIGLLYDGHGVAVARQIRSLIDMSADMVRNKPGRIPIPSAAECVGQLNAKWTAIFTELGRLWMTQVERRKPTDADIQPPTLASSESTPGTRPAEPNGSS
jgi:hypothetical protein